MSSWATVSWLKILGRPKFVTPEIEIVHAAKKFNIKMNMYSNYIYNLPVYLQFNHNHSVRNVNLHEQT